MKQGTRVAELVGHVPSLGNAPRPAGAHGPVWLWVHAAGAADRGRRRRLPPPGAPGRQCDR